MDFSIQHPKIANEQQWIILHLMLFFLFLRNLSNLSFNNLKAAITLFFNLYSASYLLYLYRQHLQYRIFPLVFYSLDPRNLNSASK